MKPDDYVDKVGLNRIKKLQKLHEFLLATTSYSCKDCRIIASMIYYTTAYKTYDNVKRKCHEFVKRLENS